MRKVQNRLTKRDVHTNRFCYVGICLLSLWGLVLCLSMEPVCKVGAFLLSIMFGVMLLALASSISAERE
jgi:hypothetical protein